MRYALRVTREFHDHVDLVVEAESLAEAKRIAKAGVKGRTKGWTRDDIWMEVTSIETQ